MVVLVTDKCGESYKISTTTLLNGMSLSNQQCALHHYWYCMYILGYYSSTVMMLLRLVDPEGSKRRCHHRLKRRVYQNKVLRIISLRKECHYNRFLGPKLCVAPWWVWQVDTLWISDSCLYWWVGACGYFHWPEWLSCTLAYRYSRRILWLRVATTNKDPKVILLYYLLTVFTTQGIVNNLQLSNVTII